LHNLHELGLFERNLVFKGGTALRKFRAGNAGRFSTDLDFSAPEEDLALDVLQALDGVDVDGFRFAIPKFTARWCRPAARPSCCPR
jgi:uncharacterized protein